MSRTINFVRAWFSSRDRWGMGGSTERHPPASRQGHFHDNQNTRSTSGCFFWDGILANDVFDLDTRTLCGRDRHSLDVDTLEAAWLL